MSTLALRPKNQQICGRCKNKYCSEGSENAWGCPYGLDAGKLDSNSECGLCLECLRSCRYDNITVYKRPFASETGTVHKAQAWQTIAIFTLALVYSILYEGHWPWVREYVNILDKNNWGLFGIYTVVVWSAALVLMPAMVYIVSIAGLRWSEIKEKPVTGFLRFSGALLPLGLTLWIAFVIPMLFVNVSFILQSLSDPFGWGWDFLGTANMPWHQLLPEYIPLMQSMVILTGFWFSLRNLKRTYRHLVMKPWREFRLLTPMAVVLTGFTVVMIVFFTN